MKYLLIAAMALVTVVVHGNNSAAVRERLKNDPFMVPFYTGEILPKPQHVEYKSEFFPLEIAGILLDKAIKQDDPRLKLLLNRINQYGGSYVFVDSIDNDCDTVFAIGTLDLTEDLKVPSQPQGYAVKTFKKNGKNVVAVKGSDQVGITWAMNSLLQMVTLQGNKTVLHAFDTTDWPYIVNRGAIGPGARPYTDASILYPTITKLNRFLFSMGVLVPRRAAPKDWLDWRKPRPEKIINQIETIGANLKGLGIGWHAWLCLMAKTDDELSLDCGSDADFDIVWKMSEPVLKAGGGLCYGPDDYRFPINVNDKKRFGSAREADVFFINRLYKKMKANYPKATMSLVHPFYWGPTTQNPWSKESPIDYLQALGERIPEDIEIAWSGPSVKTAGFSKKKVEKYKNLIKRKPFLFQNSSDFYHIYRYIYPTDEINWWLGNGRTKGVYKELGGAFFNSLGLYPDMLWSAMLWNPDGYNKKEAAFQATCKLIGPENYKTLKHLVAELAWFDQFGKLKKTPFAARKFKEIEKRFLVLKKLSSEYENNPTHPAAVKKWASLSWPIRCIDIVFLQGLRKDKELLRFVNQGAQVESVAKKEINYQADVDQVFTAYSLKGGRKVKKIFGREATWVNGAESKYPSMSFKFELDHYPPEHDYKLLICGRDGGKSENCQIEITLNGKSIFKGPNPFNKKEWSVQQFSIPMPALERYNKMIIMNIEKTAGSMPYFAVNYTAIRKLIKKENNGEIK